MVGPQSAPNMWNSMPNIVTTADSQASFKSRLRTQAEDSGS